MGYESAVIFEYKSCNSCAIAHIKLAALHFAHKKVTMKMNNCHDIVLVSFDIILYLIIFLPIFKMQNVPSVHYHGE